jgi:hypothetical protein
MGTEEEKIIVTALISDLNEFYGVGLDPSPKLERGVSTQVTPITKGRLILVGASHMVRLAKSLGPGVITLAYPGFKPSVAAVTHIVEKLGLLKLEKNDTVICDLLSNVAFMGTDEGGLPTEASRAEDGRFHIIGSLTTAPPSVIKKNLAMCTPLSESIGNAGTVLISPIPRYVYNRCCSNTTHVENLTDPDYDEEIGMGLEGIKRIIRNWATELLPNFALIDPTMLNDACDLGIKTRVTDTGSCPWDDDDPVHLSAEGYRDLAGHLREHVSSEHAIDEASVSGSDFSGGKRRAPDSVITTPVPKRGRGNRPIRVAGWLMGRPDYDSDRRRGNNARARADTAQHRQQRGFGHGSRGPHPGWRHGAGGRGRRGRRGRWWY